MIAGAAVACFAGTARRGFRVAFAKSYIQLMPSLVNSPADVDKVLAAVQSLTRG